MLLREYTDRNNIRGVTTRDGLPRGSKTDFDRYARRRGRELIGRVPARVTYNQFLMRQSAEFQDNVLGRTRGRLLRQGDLSVDRFVDYNTGRRFTLDELRVREAAAFERAGL